MLLCSLPIIYLKMASSGLNNNTCKFKAIDKKYNCDILITFPEVINGKIDTKKFLDASLATAAVLDKVNKIFTPIKYIIQNNVEKIMKKYQANVREYSTIQDLILSEKNYSKKMSVTDSLIWLLRGLKMVMLFIEEIVKSSKTGEFIEDLGANIRYSYKKSLEPYHDWMAIQLFSLLIRMAPTKSKLMLALANDLPNREEQVLQAMEYFTNGLKTNLINLEFFINDNNLDVIS
ncbi:glycolipid transfer protein 1 [Chelonus insularis]|uniref:glycolipid transfer protein 1 n=1 Tax=Chelonus insularis TaxID=460826 RepID=UPI0015899B50|nr:glycolipid transfer protein 1 [Chelonus insularis]